jgi:hypothetical protein
MTATIRTGLPVWVACVLLMGATSASAQVLGSFRWNLAPHCNVLTLRVEQKGAIYELAGTDDQCGAPVAAAANGSAHVNPDGTASLAITVIRPDGIAITSHASINLTTLSGTWSDEYANGGAFTFNPPGVMGSPRRVTLRGNYGIIFNAAAASQDGTSAISFGRTLPAVPLVPAANIILFGAAPTANCPGSLSDPQAAPGHLCIYERGRGNTSVVAAIDSETAFNRADDTGAVMFARSSVAGQVNWRGKWAVTIP